MWKAFHEDDTYSVYNLNKEGEKIGDAIFSSKEEQAAKSFIARWDKNVDFYSWTATSFADLEDEREATETANAASRLASEFHMLVDNIMWADEEDVPDKSNAVRELANEFSSLLDSVTKSQPEESNN